MHKLIPAAFVLVFLSACNFSKKSDNSTTVNLTSDTSAQNQNPWMGLDTIIINDKLCHLDSITEADFNAIKKSQPDTVLPTEIKESKEGVRISLKNGDSLFFQNIMHFDSATQIEMDDVQQYQYYASYPGTDYWLVTIAYYESEGYFLVNKQNGRQTSTIEMPILSPDKKKFASAHCDPSGENSNGIDLYKITSDSLQLVFSVPSQSIQEVKWFDNNTLYLLQSTYNQNQQLTRYAKLNLNQLLIGQ